MGMPVVDVSFTEVAATVVNRGNRGIVGLILKDNIYKDKGTTILGTNDIPKTMTEENKTQIKMALKGYINKPKKIIVYIIDSTSEDVDYTNALDYFEVNKINYLAIPTVETDGMLDTVVTWVEEQRENGNMVKAVLPNVKADCEGIINYTTEWVSDGTIQYTTEQYCARIAGVLAGTPIRISATYATLPELTDCQKLKKEEKDAAVDNGEFIVHWDGEKVKTARAVTSLTTTTSEKGKSFKKIKIVETTDMIKEDITKTAEDGYLGKYENSWENKCLLISAILGYFLKLKEEKVLESYSVDIDTEAVAAYLKAQGTDIEDMTDEEIRQADTDEKVFLMAQLKIYDVMEDIYLPISI
ncbi:MAG: phage tail sheath subtilisin-like domain-containing protein [Lachnospiraceae bacterium]